MNGDSDFGTFGRFQETRAGQMPADMRDAYDFTMKLRGLVAPLGIFACSDDRPNTRPAARSPLAPRPALPAAAR
ncbi:MAG: hypothetical protein ACRDRJ_46655, partial [Streptosporangiaceae bacterium]